MIAASGLTRRFGDRVVVDHVTFEMRRGEILALLGPNGAGKTTTMRMLAGLIAPTSGTVTIDGIALTHANGAAHRARIGFLTESPGLWDRLTVRENLTVYARLYGLNECDRRIDRVLDRLQLLTAASARAAELSKGMRQKTAIARALLHDPDILLLDEPTSGLDPEIAREVRLLLEEKRAQGGALLVSTHNLDEAERLADRVAVLQRRLLALDPPAALRRRLTNGRLLIRVNGHASSYVAVVTATGADARADDGRLVITLRDPERETPGLVAALVTAGAEVLEVRPEARLEEAYLQLVKDS